MRKQCARHYARTAGGRPTVPSRQNRKALASWQDEAAINELKRLVVELGTTQQALIAEGINLVLAKYAKPTVAT